MRVAALRNDLDANISSIRNGSVFADRTFSSVLSGINFFETCQTTIESNCTIGPTAMPPPCITSEVLLDVVSSEIDYDVFQVCLSVFKINSLTSTLWICGVCVLLRLVLHPFL